MNILNTEMAQMEVRTVSLFVMLVNDDFQSWIFSWTLIAQAKKLCSCMAPCGPLLEILCYLLQSLKNGVHRDKLVLTSIMLLPTGWERRDRPAGAHWIWWEKGRSFGLSWNILLLPYLKNQEMFHIYISSQVNFIVMSAIYYWHRAQIKLQSSLTYGAD